MEQLIVGKAQAAADRVHVRDQATLVSGGHPPHLEGALLRPPCQLQCEAALSRLRRSRTARSRGGRTARRAPRTAAATVTRSSLTAVATASRTAGASYCRTRSAP